MHIVLKIQFDRVCFRGGEETVQILVGMWNKNKEDCYNRTSLVTTECLRLQDIHRHQTRPPRYRNAASGSRLKV